MAYIKDRATAANKTHNLGAQLTPENPLYKQWIFRYTFLELEKDLGKRGDITSETIVPAEMKYPYKIVSRSEGILCGVQEVKYFLCESDPAFKPRLGKIETEFLKNDGDVVINGGTIMVLNGAARNILKVERIVLNLLQRMSGVATLARKFVDAARAVSENVLITPTRKTLWGLLDKRACFVGGAGTHRLNLEDAILIKDTHLRLPGVTIESALKKAYKSAKTVGARFVEIEVENIDDGVLAAGIISSFKDKAVPFVIMLDNIAPQRIVEFIKRMKRDAFLIEASGGINSENVSDYAKTGVDIISAGALTMDAKSMDFSMEVKI